MEYSTICAICGEDSMFSICASCEQDLENKPAEAKENYEMSNTQWEFLYNHSRDL